MAVLYEHASAQGYWRAFYFGNTCWNQALVQYYVGDDMNDRASSAYANESYGCNTFRFYLDANLVNGPYTRNTPVNYVGDDINDRVSSFIVYRR